MLKLNSMTTKLWYLKNLDMFSHLRDEEMSHVIEKTSSMKEIKRGDILYLQGTSDRDIYILKIKLTHQDLSELIASTRETTTLTLNNLKKDGLIDYGGKYIRIIDKDRLEAIYSHP